MIANYITFQKELQATSWIDAEIKFNVTNGKDYFYRQDWIINGVPVMRFRYWVDAETMEVKVWNQVTMEWKYSHKLFEV